MFTTLSGAGFGALAWQGVLFPLDPGSASPFITVLALGLCGAGLTSSLFHLRHPERAWRALSQWRSSWLSREGVAALVTFVPAVAFAGLLLIRQPDNPLVIVAGVAMTLLALVTIISTAMIYRSLRTIVPWSSPWTVPVFLAMGLTSGGLVVVAATTLVAGTVHDGPVALVAVCLAAAALIRMAAWRAGAPDDTATAASALGLAGRARSVHPLENPSTSATWVEREMVFTVARRHARRLRRATITAGFLLPLALLLAGTASASPFPVVLAAFSCLAGIMIERWLFFGEARHKVAHYFRRDLK